MNWTSIKHYCGLQAPFDFKRAGPFLLGGLAGTIALIVAVISALSGSLNLGTERFYFLLYLFCLCLAAMLLCRFTILAICIVFWCATELGVGLTSNLTAAYGVGETLLPANQFPFQLFHQFVYHPLLQAVPKPRWEERTRMGLLNGQYWSDYWAHRNKDNDRELVFHHNSIGVRGEELTQEDLRRRLIFLYGGSTTYDLGVTQGETWAEQLQKLFNSRATVLNFGVPGYSTVEHVIQTAFYGSVAGRRPVCAVYYIGWNDIRNAHILPVDGGYANFHLLGQLDTLAVRSQGLTVANYSPILTLISAKLRSKFDSVPEPVLAYGKTPVAGTDEQLEKVFVDHVATIASINGSRGVRTLYIGQLLNRRKLTADKPYGWLPLVKDRDVWNLQEHFNQILQSTSASLGVKYVGLDVNDFGSDDFVDNGHFSTAGAAKFARMIYPTVDALCR